MAAYGDDLVVWGIASRETEDRVRAWAEYHDIDTMPLLLDLDGQELRIPRNTSSQPDRVFIRGHRKHLFGRP